MIKSCCKLSYELAQEIFDEMFVLEDSKIMRNGCPQLHDHFEFPNVIRYVKDLHAISKKEVKKKL